MAYVKEQRLKTVREVLKTKFGRLPTQYKKLSIIHDDDSVDEFVAAVKKDPIMPYVVGFDAEFLSDKIPFAEWKNNKCQYQGSLPVMKQEKGPFIRLFQFATASGHTFIFDCYEFNHLPLRILRVLCNEKSILIGFDHKNDLKALANVFGSKNFLSAAKIIDLKMVYEKLSAADQEKFLIPSPSLKHMAERAFNITVEKSIRGSQRDWEMPLVDFPDAHVDYCAKDPLLHLDMALFFGMLGWMPIEFVTRMAQAEISSFIELGVPYRSENETTTMAQLDAVSDEELDAEIEVIDEIYENEFSITVYNNEIKNGEMQLGDEETAAAPVSKSDTVAKTRETATEFVRNIKLPLFHKNLVHSHFKNIMKAWSAANRALKRTDWTDSIKFLYNDYREMYDEKFKNLSKIMSKFLFTLIDRCIKNIHGYSEWVDLANQIDNKKVTKIGEARKILGLKLHTASTKAVKSKYKIRPSRSVKQNDEASIDGRFHRSKIYRRITHN